MDKLIVEGPSTLTGRVHISRAKNACLPILAAIILTNKPITLKNIPELQDISTMIKLLTQLGVVVVKNPNGDMIFDASRIHSYEATYDLVKTMRASIFVLGPLLARFKCAHVSLPGGCAIGTRPIDIHLANLEKMGVVINLDHGYVDAKAEVLKGAHVTLSFPSVGATENIMMAAVFAEGITVINNAALEPEVDDLAHFLNSLGAKIRGIGTKTITIEGVTELSGGTYEAIGDRIEGATYIMAALASKSDIVVTGMNPIHLEFVINLLKEMNAVIEIRGNDIHVFGSHSTLKPAVVDTAPYPGFPTDAQAQLMALALTIPGTTIITEHIFENRFMHVPELIRLGADIKLKGKSAIISGGHALTAAPVMCTDLRASAALIIAALAANGKTEIQRIYHLDRGYEKLEKKLLQLNAKVSRLK